MEQHSDLYFGNAKDIINSFVDIGKITLYLVNSKGFWEAQYYSVIELDKVDSAVKEIEDFLFSLATDNKKKLVKTALNEWCSKFEIEGETEYSFQIFVGTAICTTKEFEEAQKTHSVKQMLEAIQKE